MPFAPLWSEKEAGVPCRPAAQGRRPAPDVDMEPSRASLPTGSPPALPAATPEAGRAPRVGVSVLWSPVLSPCCASPRVHGNRAARCFSPPPWEWGCPPASASSRDGRAPRASVCVRVCVYACCQHTGPSSRCPLPAARGHLPLTVPQAVPSGALASGVQHQR